MFNYFVVLTFLKDFSIGTHVQP